MTTRLNGGVLGREPERVETVGRQDGFQAWFGSDNKVAENVVTHVTLVGRSRRVRVHAQSVETLARIVVIDLVGAVIEPARLPFLLNGIDVKRASHYDILGNESRSLSHKESKTMSDSTFVLVHGAWHGAWCWRHLGEELTRRGERWIAVDLPSSTPGAHANTYLADDAREVVGAADINDQSCSLATVTAAR